MDNFINNIYLQHCGDSLKILQRAEKSGYFEYEFLRYCYKGIATKANILQGKVNNPLIEQNEFIGQTFEQTCGDFLKVLEKTNIRNSNNKILFRCIFIKYPYEILVAKDRILLKSVVNPLIEQEEFVKKEWLQHCGDTLKIVEKTNIKGRGNDYLFRCQFLKYPYEILTDKFTIIKGEVLNPQIEVEEFQNKIWEQKCGDSLKILRKTNIKENGNYLWEVEFIKYPYKVITFKHSVIKREVYNPNLPWRDKKFLEEYIKRNYKEKPNLKILANDFDLSCSYIGSMINQFELRDCINYYPDIEENQVREFVKSIYNGEVIKYSGKKEDNYYEIDIYLPELKKGIEYNGSPWHEEGNPNNKFSKPMGYHKKKQEIFAKKGIEVLFVWDYEWFEDFPKKQIINEQTKQKIREFLNT